MKNKKIVFCIIFSAVIHIAVLIFLFRFSSSKPLPDSDAPVSLVSLISPKTELPQKSKQTSPSPQKNISQNQNKEIPQKSEQTFFPSEITENKTNEITENAATSEINKNDSELTNAPRALYMPQIPYPRAAKSAKIEGTAEIAYIIDEKGRVSSVEILSIPHISFENIIKRAVLSWRFAPATQNGNPVSIKATKTIVFKLTE